MKDFEIEIKVSISQKANLQKFLSEKATFKGQEYQKDEYFTPAHRNFTAVKPTAEWLRLRSSDKDDAITYKKWHFDSQGKSQYCDEYESPIGDIDQLRKIFKALDIEPLVTVEKTRKIYKYKDYEIALDTVTNLGDFVEIEYKTHGDVKDHKQITDAMVALLKDIGCGEIERNYVGYPFMLLYPDEIKSELV